MLPDPPPTVYVTNLPVTSTKESLVPFFSAHGTIRDLVVRSKRSSASAIICYASHAEAENVIQSCNFRKISTWPIHIKWAFTAHTFEPRSRLAVRSLDPAVDERVLFDAFSAYGDIDDILILRNSSGVSTGVATVQFIQSDSALRAKTELHGRDLNGTPMHISNIPPHSKATKLVPLPPSIISVVGDREAAAELLTEFGAIANRLEFRDHRLFLFEETDAAVTAAANFAHEGVLLYTFVPDAVFSDLIAWQERHRVFATDFSKDDAGGLREFLTTAGKVVSVHMTEKDGHRMAVAEFGSEESRASACAELDGRPFGRRRHPIRVLPFFDDRLPHAIRTWLVQVNELELGTTLGEFRGRFPGSLAAAIVPTIHGSAVGYALVTNPDGVDVGANGIMIEAGEPRRAVGWFSNHGRLKCVVVRGVADVEAQASAIGSVSSVGVAGDAAVVYFETAEGAADCCDAMIAAGGSADLYGDHIMCAANKLLYAAASTVDMPGPGVFVTNLPLDIGTAALRQAFAVPDQRVFATVLYAGESGKSKGQGVVKFAREADAGRAVTKPPTAAIPGIVVRILNPARPVRRARRGRSRRGR
jgi:RNA recognition motif-containing protein